MTTLVLPFRAPVPILSELFARHRALASFGIAALFLATFAVAMQAVDTRTLQSGVNVWVKPAKFFFSTGLFALTAAWFFGHVREERRRAPMLRAAAAVLILSATFELAWISWQGANGLESHFNGDTRFYGLMFSLMGLFALLLIGTTLPLAWEIARRPAPGLPPVFVAAVVTGLVLTFLLGTVFGMAVALNGGHSVGPEAEGLPVFGWNRIGGDLRIAHFLGVHAEQAIPILGLLALRLARPLRWAAFGAGTVVYVGLAVAAFLQAKAGEPLLPF